LAIIRILSDYFKIINSASFAGEAFGAPLCIYIKNPVILPAGSRAEWVVPGYGNCVIALETLDCFSENAASPTGATPGDALDFVC
jgi:hypothetical protein